MFYTSGPNSVTTSSHIASTSEVKTTVVVMVTNRLYISALGNPPSMFFNTIWALFFNYDYHGKL